MLNFRKSKRFAKMSASERSLRGYIVSFNSYTHAETAHDFLQELMQKYQNNPRFMKFYEQHTEIVLPLIETLLSKRVL